MFSNQDNTPSPIRFTPGKDSNDLSNKDFGTRPTGDPKSRKDFKKILGNNSKDSRREDSKVEDTDEEDADEVIALGDSNAKKQVPTSPFGLASAIVSNGMLGQSTKANPPATQNPHQQVDSPSILFSKLSESKKLGESEIGFRSPSSDKDKFTTRFATEQPDLSYINPLTNINPKPIDQLNLRVENAVNLPEIDIQELIKQLLEKVYQIKNDGKTETTLTLQKPSILAGTNLVVTSFDSARGEFNLSFQNLTQAAKNLLDLKANQDSLRLALEEKGYAVHIVMTTTILENQPIEKALSDSREEAKEQDRDGQNRHKRDQESEA